MPKPKSTLNPRELEVLALIAEGKTFRQIGDILGIAKRTANAHARSIIGKFGARNGTHAQVLAIRDGLFGSVKSASCVDGPQLARVFREEHGRLQSCARPFGAA